MFNKRFKNALLTFYKHLLLQYYKQKLFKQTFSEFILYFFL